MLECTISDRSYALQTGNNDSETLKGDSSKDLLCGRGGNDKLKGKGDEDILVSGNGEDTLLGGGGNDALIADGGTNNILKGGGGEDNYYIIGKTCVDQIPQSQELHHSVIKDYSSFSTETIDAVVEVQEPSDTDCPNPQSSIIEQTQLVAEKSSIQFPHFQSLQPESLSHRLPRNFHNVLEENIKIGERPFFLYVFNQDIGVLVAVIPYDQGEFRQVSPIATFVRSIPEPSALEENTKLTIISDRADGEDLISRFSIDKFFEFVEARGENVPVRSIELSQDSLAIGITHLQSDLHMSQELTGNGNQVFWSSLPGTQNMSASIDLMQGLLLLSSFISIATLKFFQSFGKQ